MSATTRPLPEWFDAAKLGIFIHWTAAAIPGYGALRHPELGANADWETFFRDNPYAEWYQNSIAIPGSPAAVRHAERYGERPFDEFVAQFRAGIRSWDPEPWADLFARAGARYVVLVTKHADGFALWPTGQHHPHKPEWHAPRDVVGELAAAVRARGMRFGTYYMSGVDWSFGGLPITDMASLLAATPTTEEFAAYVYAQWHELIDRYEPSLLWNDMGSPPGLDVTSLFDHYLRRVPDGVINNRFDLVRQSTGDLDCDFLTPEYSTEAPAGRKWEACRGMGTSFGFNREETDATYTPAAELIRTLVDVVARGGNLLLNVGPTGAGDIPWAQANRLLSIGRWLEDNGHAIYATRPWVRASGTTADGLEVRYTATDDAVYALVLGAPTGDCVELDVGVDRDAMVATPSTGAWRSRPWTETPRGIRIDLAEPFDERPAVAFRLSPATAVRSDAAT